MRRELRSEYQKRFVFCQHHESHAASAFYPSPFASAAILTLDGVGEWTTTSFGKGEGNRLQMLGEIRFPHSLGLLYSAFTYFSGFRVNSGEYKLMGLAPYGEPKYAELILQRLVDLKDDGSFRLRMEYFNYCQGLTMTSRRFHQLFGALPRPPETAVRQLDMDLAASIQAVTETIVLKMAAHVQRLTGEKNLCLAGGVALNCVANGRLLREGPFEKIWIQPAAGDAGGALGVAQLIWHQLLGKPRTVTGDFDSQSGTLLGPEITTDDARSALIRAQAVYHECADEGEMIARVVDLLASEKVVGWVQGRMEFGPRALGGRSILGDPRSRAMQSVMNLKIKFRESFRPFAPSALRERAADFFELSPETESPYMLLVCDVRGAREGAGPATEEVQQRQGLDRVNEVRGALPAITHVDYSARVQTVDSVRFPRYHRLLTAFAERTGCPVLINTSFNVRGEPIVCTAEDAYRCFMATNMDALVIDRFIILKEQQLQADDAEVAEHLRKFALD
jgi:carbamoyltransferase